MVPKLIEVKTADLWKHKDMSKVKDFKKIEIISDWTFSTTYKGSVRYISNNKQRIKDETSLDIGNSDEKIGHIKVDSTEEQIPVERLGRENPIIHYAEVY